MATQTVSPRTPAQHSFTGSTITELETLVERTILDARPLLSVAQIRVLLRVFDACEQCEGTGTTYYSRGGDSGDNLLAEKCDQCNGKGHVVPENDLVAQ